MTFSVEAGQPADAYAMRNSFVNNFRHIPTPVAAGLAAVAMRLVFTLGVIAIAAFEPEASLGVLFDVPTLALYFVAARFGADISVRGAADPVFFSIGCAVWFCGAALLVLILQMLLRKHPSGGYPMDENAGEPRRNP